MPINFLERPVSVPPPTPLPPRCLTFPPSAAIKAVPVPILIITAFERPDRKRPPRPQATNSSTLMVSTPKISSLINDEPTPVIITFSISLSPILLSVVNLPNAP